MYYRYQSNTHYQISYCDEMSDGLSSENQISNSHENSSLLLIPRPIISYSQVWSLGPVLRSLPAHYSLTNFWSLRMDVIQIRQLSLTQANQGWMKMHLWECIVFSDARRQPELDGIVFFCSRSRCSKCIFNLAEKKTLSLFQSQDLCLSVLETGLQSILAAAEWWLWSCNSPFSSLEMCSIALQGVLIGAGVV